MHTAVLTGRLRAPERRKQEALVASGEASVVVGTHALFQGGVDFRDLALVIIDEQHRFGVHQRLGYDKGNEGDGEHVPPARDDRNAHSADARERVRRS